MSSLPDAAQQTGKDMANARANTTIDVPQIRALLHGECEQKIVIGLEMGIFPTSANTDYL